MSKNYITQTINNQRVITIASNWTSYAHGLSSKERILAHFLWDPGPMNVTKSRQKSDLLLKMSVTLISDLKKLVARSINDNFLLQI